VRLVILLLLMAVGLERSVPPPEVALVYSFGLGGENVLDTGKAIFTRHMPLGHPVTVGLRFTTQELTEIAEKARSTGFFNQPTYIPRSACEVTVAPESTFCLHIKWGTRDHTVWWSNNCEPDSLHQLRTLIDSRLGSKDEYSRIPAPCRDEIRSPRGTIKERGPFTDDELNMLAAVYDQLVLGGALERTTSDTTRPLELTVALATVRDTNISPPDSFLTRISTDSVKVRGPGDVKCCPRRCRLRLWSWVNPDTAKVEVTVESDNSLMLNAIAVREGGGWRVCLGGIGYINGILKFRQGSPSN
jgi:hypothetical protein